MKRPHPHFFASLTVAALGLAVGGCAGVRTEKMVDCVGLECETKAKTKVIPHRDEFVVGLSGRLQFDRPIHASVDNFLARAADPAQKVTIQSGMDRFLEPARVICLRQLGARPALQFRVADSRIYISTDDDGWLEVVQGDANFARYRALIAESEPSPQAVRWKTDVKAEIWSDKSDTVSYESRITFVMESRAAQDGKFARVRHANKGALQTMANRVNADLVHDYGEFLSREYQLNVSPISAAR